MKITKNIEVVSDDYRDEFGIKRTRVEVLFTNPDGVRVHIPTVPPIKIKDSDYLDNSVKLTKADYEEIFERVFASLTRNA